MDLAEFEHTLREKLKNYKKPRPLICDGNPLDCEIFIVGINAATELNKDFWSFWDEETGFNKTEWFKNYILERKTKPLKPGRTRRNKLSNTRRRIEWIIESAHPMKVLETNLFVKATPTADELTNEDKESSIFEFLVKSIVPKIIFIHGNEVIEYFQKLYGLTIEKNKIETFEIYGTRISLLATNHLSRGWSKHKSQELGEQLSSAVNNQY